MNTLKTSELVTDDGAIDALIKKLEKLGGTYESVIATIKGEAAELAKSNQTVNASTAAGREENVKQAKAADELAQAYKRYNSALSENKIQVEELKVAARTLGELKKNEARLNLSAEGSYNKLAAQYNIIKLNLNAMSKAEREGTVEGQKLVKTANEIYQEMKRLQAETGKTALNVGNYSEAVQEATKNVGEMRKELMALRNTSFAGKTEEEIATINKRIGDLVDGMADLKAEQAALGTEMSSLFVGNLKFVAAGVEGLVGTLSILGVESENLRNLESKMIQLIGVTQALAEIEDVLQKRTLQTTAVRIQAAVVNAKDTVVKWANTVATTAAARAEDAKSIATTRGSIATRAAAAVQWAWNAALAANPIGAVIVGVIALTAGIAALAKSMRTGVDEADRLKEGLGAIQRLAEENEAFRQFQLQLAGELGKSDIERTNIEKEQAAIRKGEIQTEIALLEKLRTTKINGAGAGAVERGLRSDEIERLKALSAERVAIDRKEILLRERLKKQEADAERERIANEVEAIKKRSDEAEQRAKAAKAERERIANEAKARLKERQEAALRELETEKAYQLARFDAETDYGNQSAEYQRVRAGERLNLEQELAKALLNVQRQYNRISQTEYETALLDMGTAMKDFSARMTAERNAETPGAIPGIDLSKGMEQKALERVKQIAQSLADKSKAEIQKGNDTGDSWWAKLFGVPKEDEQMVQSAFQTAKANLAEYMQALQRAADLRVQIADRNVEAAEREYDRQVQFKEAGLAYDLQTAAAKLDIERNAQRDALQEQQKTQRQQILLNSALEASNLAVAIAKMFSTNPILAIPLSALMVGSFIAAKIKAVQATKQEFAEGGFEFIGGGTHASGNDTPLGFATKSGKQAYAQKGEFHGIVRHEQVPKYKSILPALINGMNSGALNPDFMKAAITGLPPVFVQSSTNTAGLEKHLSKIAENTSRSDETFVSGNVVIRRSGNWTVRTTLG